MKKLLFLGYSIIVLAQGNDKLNILQDLNNASKIATRTKLNIDKTPAIVSVLHANTLKKLGVLNLYEALDTVPGIEVSMGTAGAKQINMRGNKSLIRDKIKLMINGVSVNSELSDTSSFYLDMPIELIKRIEIIRGPASALYGSFAHIGVINVITKSSTYKGNMIFSNISSKNFKNIGFTQSAHMGKFKLSLDGFFLGNKNSRSYGPYSLISSSKSLTSYENFTNKSLGINIKYAQDLSLQARWLKLRTQNFFGYGVWPINKNPKELQTTSFINELRYNPTLSQRTSLDIKAGYKQYEFEGNARYIPYSLLPTPPYPQYDLIGGGYYKEETFYTDLALNYNFKNHKILFGTYISKTKEVNTRYSKNNPNISEDTNIEVNNIKKNITRNQYAFYLNDIYTISNKWTMDLGARYDYYSDADSSLAPKLALVYNKDDVQTYKLMYQRSFRVPSFLELYSTDIPYIGDTSLKSETIDTVEFAYRHQNAFNNYFSINLFYSDMKNFINRNSDFKFFNDGDIHSYGTELEYKFPLNESTLIQSNYSYVNIQDANHRDLAFVSNHLANIMLFKQLNRNWNMGSKIRYVGAKKRELKDTRSNLHSYTTFNQAITYKRKKFSIQMAVKNIFDADIRFPSKLGNSPISGTYINDFPRDGRVFWLSAQWSL